MRGDTSKTTTRLARSLACCLRAERAVGQRAGADVRCDGAGAGQDAGERAGPPGLSPRLTASKHPDSAPAIRAPRLEPHAGVPGEQCWRTGGLAD
jgi:hypothetical protein